MGMLKYNELYKKVKEDRVADNGAFDSECMMHWVEKTRSTKRKRRRDNGSPKFDSK
jgi:tetrahydromethanopterin S-methyltransferase subunit A